MKKFLNILYTADLETKANNIAKQLIRDIKEFS